MCMLFLYVNPNPGANGFYLILANTRDEFFYRPSRVGHFWEHNPNIIGGMDFEEGKQGGTWLAMNTSGQVATLLNLMRPLSDMDGTKKDRGFLAVKFLESGIDGVNYLQRLRREADMYQSFLLVTIDVKPMMGDVTAAYYTNDGDEGPVILKKGVHVFGNSSPSQPWKKVNAAKQMFEEVISRQPNSSQKEELLSDIFRVLRNDTLHYPDEQLDRDTEGRPEEYVKQLSAIFIKPEQGIYGSRMECTQNPNLAVVIYKLPKHLTKEAMKKVTEVVSEVDIELSFNDSSGQKIYFYQYSPVRKLIELKKLQIRSELYYIYPIVTNLTVHGAREYAHENSHEFDKLKYLMSLRGRISDIYVTEVRIDDRKIPTQNYRVILQLIENKNSLPKNLLDGVHLKDKVFTVTFFCRHCREENHLRTECISFNKDSLVGSINAELSYTMVKKSVFSAMNIARTSFFRRNSVDSSRGHGPKDSSSLNPQSTEKEIPSFSLKRPIKKECQEEDNESLIINYNGKRINSLILKRPIEEECGKDENKGYVTKKRRLLSSLEVGCQSLKNGSHSKQDGHHSLKDGGHSSDDEDISIEYERILSKNADYSLKEGQSLINGGYLLKDRVDALKDRNHSTEDASDSLEDDGSSLKDGNNSAEDRSYSVEYKKHFTEDGKHSIEDGKHSIEDGKHSIEDGNYSIEDGGGGSLENRGNSAEDGGGSLENGDNSAEDGGGSLENGDNSAENENHLIEDKSLSLEVGGHSSKDKGHSPEYKNHSLEVRGDSKEDENEDDDIVIVYHHIGNSQCKSKEILNENMNDEVAASIKNDKITVIEESALEEIKNEPETDLNAEGNIQFLMNTDANLIEVNENRDKYFENIIFGKEMMESLTNTGQDLENVLLDKENGNDDLNLPNENLEEFVLDEKNVDSVRNLQTQLRENVGNLVVGEGNTEDIPNLVTHPSDGQEKNIIHEAIGQNVLNLQNHPSENVEKIIGEENEGDEQKVQTILRDYLEKFCIKEESYISLVALGIESAMDLKTQPQKRKRFISAPELWFKEETDTLPYDEPKRMRTFVIPDLYPCSEETDPIPVKESDKEKHERNNLTEKTSFDDKTLTESAVKKEEIEDNFADNEIAKESLGKEERTAQNNEIEVITLEDDDGEKCLSEKNENCVKDEKMEEAFLVDDEKEKNLTGIGKTTVKCEEIEIFLIKDIDKEKRFSDKNKSIVKNEKTEEDNPVDNEKEKRFSDKNKSIVKNEKTEEDNPVDNEKEKRLSDKDESIIKKEKTEENYLVGDGKEKRLSDKVENIAKNEETDDNYAVVDEKGKKLPEKDENTVKVKEIEVIFLEDGEKEKFDDEEDKTLSESAIKKEEIEDNFADDEIAKESLEKEERTPQNNEIEVIILEDDEGDFFPEKDLSKNVESSVKDEKMEETLTVDHEKEKCLSKKDRIIVKNEIREENFQVNEEKERKLPEIGESSLKNEVEIIFMKGDEREKKFPETGDTVNNGEFEIILLDGDETDKHPSEKEKSTPKNGELEVIYLKDDGIFQIVYYASKKKHLSEKKKSTLRNEGIEMFFTREDDEDAKLKMIKELFGLELNHDAPKITPNETKEEEIKNKGNDNYPRIVKFDEKALKMSIHMNPSGKRTAADSNSNEVDIKTILRSTIEKAPGVSDPRQVESFLNCVKCKRHPNKLARAFSPDVSKLISQLHQINVIFKQGSQNPNFHLNVKNYSGWLWDLILRMEGHKHCEKCNPEVKK
ncbi:Transport and Golgi organization protein 2 like protein [Argiope bruennichi]|uniref:Transport and Golgi organization protein 2 like protein n=1 Tax=Argiope bruennichi TaxID=94029 RepID=A0A8T0FMZ1_ARGBR|nr:Transport and Golgi organization protein 2 like protein [Argiope bruennichi]